MKHKLTLIKPSAILIILSLSSGVYTAPTGANPQLKTDNGYTSDIFADLVVGVPLEDVKVSPPKRTISDAGMVHVVFGSTEGLLDSGNETWQQTFAGSQDKSEEGDWFGWSLASGDFNGDGRFDLAVGVPSENFPGAQGAGGVHIFYGAETGGLSTEENQFLHQDSPGVEDQVEGSDNFGGSLAVGNFNGDDYDDLAIGARLEDVGEVENAGVVHIIYGSPDGLDPQGAQPDQLWHQDQSGIADFAQPHDWFGHALATGSFNNDDYDDLAIGAPGENFTTIQASGAVHILFGSSVGLTAVDDKIWGQWLFDVHEEETYDLFGFSLAAGELWNPNIDALVIGAPEEDIVDDLGRLHTDAGAVYVIRIWEGEVMEIFNIFQGGDYIQDEKPESYDRFGWSLAATDSSVFWVGVPYENTGIAYQDTDEFANAGAIHRIVRTGGTYGPQFSSSIKTEGHGFPDQPEVGDLFGYSLAIGDFDGDGYTELAVGAPDENCSASGDGAVFINMGVHEDKLMLCQGVNLPDQGEDTDRFGYALTIMPKGSDAPDKTLPREIYLPLSICNP